MKLSPEQIERLYDFTRQHYVEYYDLQTELVDHLANAIEEQWVENPKLDFETALNIEFRKFGVMGFTGIVDKRKYELTNKYENIVKEYFKPFWKLPWVLVLIILVLLLPKFFRKEELLIIVCIAVVIELSARFLKWSYRMFKKLKYGKKTKWLFKEILEKHTPSTFSYLGLYLSYKLLESNKSDVLDYEYIISLILSFYFIYTVIYIYVVRIKIPLKTKEYLKQTYPEYEFTK